MVIEARQQIYRTGEGGQAAEFRGQGAECGAFGRKRGAFIVADERTVAIKRVLVVVDVRNRGHRKVMIDIVKVKGPTV